MDDLRCPLTDLPATRCNFGEQWVRKMSDSKVCEVRRLFDSLELTDEITYDDTSDILEKLDPSYSDSIPFLTDIVTDRGRDPDVRMLAYLALKSVCRGEQQVMLPAMQALRDSGRMSLRLFAWLAGGTSR